MTHGRITHVPLNVNNFLSGRELQFLRLKPQLADATDGHVCLPYYDYRSLKDYTNVNCSNGNKVGSKCVFTCSQPSEHRAISSSEIVCTPLGWDKSPYTNCLLGYSNNIKGMRAKLMGPGKGYVSRALLQTE